MKHQALFSSSNKSKKKIKCRLLQFLYGALLVRFIAINTDIMIMCIKAQNRRQSFFAKFVNC